MKLFKHSVLLPNILYLTVVLFFLIIIFKHTVEIYKICSLFEHE